MKSKWKLLLGLTVCIVMALFCFTACGGDQDSAEVDPEFQAFYDAVDVDYSRGLMDDLLSFTTNEDLGFKTAGSEAELAAADFLVGELETIGVQNVRKEEATIDTFTFKNADLKYTAKNGKEKQVEMAMFQTTYVAQDEEVEIVYAGDGTAADYENLDVNGKIVLIDIDQNSNWWINWPAYQAKVKGAKAVIAVNVDGYCTYSEDTLGVQDMCGPSDAPAFTMTVADAKPLKKAIKANGGSVTAVLNANGVVGHDGTGYNVIGEIPGKSSEVIYMVAHYDTYFKAFADNTSGVAAVMGISKALLDSGYEPDKTIRICFHCAEEWGVDDSRYDWARGSTILAQSHPEWKDSAFMMINIDSGVIFGGAEGVEINTPYELSGEVKKIGRDFAIADNPLEGELKVTSPAWTWTESFGYTISGIPVMDSGMYGEDHSGTYHSNNDTEEANNYSAETFAYSQKLYGSYVMTFDKMAVRNFDYTKLINKMKKTVNEDVVEDYDALLGAFNNANAAAEKLVAKNKEMAKSGDAVEFNKNMNYLFQDVSLNLFTIDWNEEFQFVHQYKQTNVECLEAAIKALEEGDVPTALDENIYAVDLNWYAYAFDKETYDYYVNQVLGPNAENSWGEGYLESNADLWEVVQSLKAKYDEKNPDVSGEIEILKAELEVQKADLASVIAKEIETLERITTTMNTLAE
ncbi:MAG: M28 family peptidase [Bacillota bacterium]|nr:M28 family peptidase [Bacillota bacterium]